MNLEQKLNSIKSCAIGALVCLIIGIVLLFVVPTLLVNIGVSVVLLMYVPMILMIVAAICEFVAAIKILATNWQNPQIESSKVLWGLLALLLLPIIAPFVFVSQAKSILKNSGTQQPSNTTPTSSTTTTTPDISKSADQW